MRGGDLIVPSASNPLQRFAVGDFHIIYDLAAGVWTKDVSKAHRISRALRAGAVEVNCCHQLDLVSPFGGYRQSGFGRELGLHALELYTRIKHVWLRV